MLFLRSLIDFPSNLHRLCIGGTLEDHRRNIGESCLILLWCKGSNIFRVIQKDYTYNIR